MEQARLTLVRVLPQTALEGWGLLSDMLKPAVEYTEGEYALDDILRAVLQGRYQLWGAIAGVELRGVMVTQLSVANGVTWCEALFLGGRDFVELKSLLPQIEDWALLNGCSKIKAFVRPGLEVKLRTLGFKEKHRVVVKDLRGRLQ